MATDWDWKRQATRLDTAKRFSEAGEAWQQAATLGKEWTYWCEAAGSFQFAAGKEDLALSDARRCISAGSGKSKSERLLSDAHEIIARVLNQRGVYEEALSHASVVSNK